MKKAKHIKTLTAILALTLTLLLAAQIKPVAAAQVKFYLHRTGTVGISPSGRHMNTIEPPKDYTTLDMFKCVEYYWYTSETYAKGGIIEAGSYILTFWASCTRKGEVTLNIKFGYCMPDGGNKTEIAVATVWTFPSAGVIHYFAITFKGDEHTLPFEARLYLVLKWTKLPEDAKIVFYYDGHDYPSNIVTPPISSSIPEFPVPVGIALLVVFIVSTYWFLRKKLPLASIGM